MGRVSGMEDKRDILEKKKESTSVPEVWKLGQTPVIMKAKF